MFGVVAALENDINHGSFRTKSRCRLLKLYREDFRRLEHVNPEIARAIRTMAIERMRAREAQVAAAQEAKAGRDT